MKRSQEAVSINAVLGAFEALGVALKQFRALGATVFASVDVVEQPAAPTKRAKRGPYKKTVKSVKGAKGPWAGFTRAERSAEMARRQAVRAANKAAREQLIGTATVVD